jgi:hypothetical protein
MGNRNLQHTTVPMADWFVTYDPNVGGALKAPVVKSESQKSVKSNAKVSNMLSAIGKSGSTSGGTASMVYGTG